MARCFDFDGTGRFVDLISATVASTNAAYVSGQEHSGPAPSVLGWTETLAEFLAPRLYFFFLVCSVLSSYSFLLCCFEEPPPRRDLNHDFKNLARGNRDGSFATQHDREVMLTLIANPLHEGGFGHLRATGVRSKHVEYLVERWHKEGIGTGTFKNWMSDCRSSLKRSARCWMMPSSWWRQ